MDRNSPQQAAAFPPFDTFPACATPSRASPSSCATEHARARTGGCGPRHGPFRPKPELAAAAKAEGETKTKESHAGFKERERHKEKKSSARNTHTHNYTKKHTPSWAPSLFLAAPIPGQPAPPQRTREGPPAPQQQQRERRTERRTRQMTWYPSETRRCRQSQDSAGEREGTTAASRSLLSLI